MGFLPEKRSSTETAAEFRRLIERIQGGDERALEKLLAAVANPLRRMADRLIGGSLRPHLDADDLVQRVSLILWRGLREGKFEVAGPQQMMGLAGILLKRQTAKAVQRLKPAIALSSTVDVDLNATVFDRPLQDPAISVTEKAARDDQIRLLMKRVNDRDRRMLELLLMGHSIAGTARIIGVEPAALRMRLSRLRVRLRKVRRIDEPHG
jgi:DNA-directed RNA polymerase specialized sigma24 family protein